MSCWTRELFLSAMARAVSRRISDAHFPENSKLKSRAGEKEKSVAEVVLMFVVVVVVVVEGWWPWWGG